VDHGRSQRGARLHGGFPSGNQLEIARARDTLLDLDSFGGNRLQKHPGWYATATATQLARGETSEFSAGRVLRLPLREQR
jgi:hypothetical protein